MHLGKLAIAAACLVAPLHVAAVPADLGNKLINGPETIKAWGVEPQTVRDKNVKGGLAMRITTTGKEAHLWDVGVYTPTNRPVRAGDRLIIAFWARLQSGPDGAATAVLPDNAIQLTSSPNVALFAGPATLTSSWQVFQISGTADKDYPAGSLSASISLATGKQVVDIGPVYILDMGQ